MTSIEDLIRLLEAANNSNTSAKPSAIDPVSKPKKRKRKPSAYQLKYAKSFKKLQHKYKTKSGKWKKDGFKRCQKAAHKEAKR